MILTSDIKGYNACIPHNSNISSHVSLSICDLVSIIVHESMVLTAGERGGAGYSVFGRSDAVNIFISRMKGL